MDRKRNRSVDGGYGAAGAQGSWAASGAGRRDAPQAQHSAIAAREDSLKKRKRYREGEEAYEDDESDYDDDAGHLHIREGEFIADRCEYHLNCEACGRETSAIRFEFGR